MEISFNEFVRQVGLDDLADIDRHELAGDFMTAAVTGLSDGDMVVIHPPYRDREAELYGEIHYGEGRVARTIARTALANGMQPGPIYDFQGFAAEYFDIPGNPFSEFQADSIVHIYTDTITIDGNPLVLDRTPQLVIDYGACLTGRSYIADQMKFMESNQPPFTYSPLTRLHFTNKVLMETYDKDYGEGIAEFMIQKQGYIGREDGVADATDEIIRAQTAHGARTDLADIILCTGIQHTTTVDLRRGIENAYSLLREDGMLIVRSLARAAAGQIDSDTLTGWAIESGFDERHLISYRIDPEHVESHLGGHFGDHETKAVVISKK